MKCDLGIIKIHLDHQRNSIDPKRPHHRLLKGVPCADRRPPEKIKSIALEEVYLSIHLATFHPKSCIKLPRRKPKPTPHRWTNRWRPTKQDLSLDQIPGFRGDYRLDETSEERDLLFDTSPVAYSLEDGQLNDLEMLGSMPRASTIAGESTSNQEIRPEGKDMSTAISSSDGTAFSSIDAYTRATYAIDLVDVAVRLTLSDKPAKVASGIKRTSENFPIRLSDIAPALFSPGYLSVGLPFRILVRFRF